MTDADKIAQQADLISELREENRHLKKCRMTQAEIAHGYISYAVFCLKKKKQNH